MNLGKPFKSAVSLIAFGVVVFFGIFLYSSKLPQPSDFAQATISSSWLDKTGEAFSVPACGSSNPSGATCNGATINWNDDGPFTRGYLDYDESGDVIVKACTIPPRLTKTCQKAKIVFSDGTIITGLPCSGSYTWNSGAQNTNYNYEVRYNEYHWDASGSDIDGCVQESDDAVDNGAATGHLISSGSFTTKNCAPPPTPPPTINLDVNGSDSTTISYGGSVNVSWGTTNTASCNVSPCPPGQSAICDDLNSAGIPSGSLTSDTTYTLSCVGTDGSNPTPEQATVNVGPPPGVCTPGDTMSSSCTTPLNCPGSGLIVCDATGNWAALQTCNDIPNDGCPSVCSPLQGSSCTSNPNSCGNINSGTYQCDGSCSAVTPSDPANLDDPCTSSTNSCGMFDSGNIQCDGSCSAVTPSDALCSSPSVNLTASPGSLVQGTGIFDVDWQYLNGSSSSWDWIGMFVAGAPDSFCFIDPNCVDWQYAVESSPGSNAGIASFTSSFNPGDYDFRYFKAFVATKLGTSNQVTIDAPTQCSDGIDNADPEDTLVDMSDPGCSSASDDDETNSVSTECSDGIDNSDPEDTLIDMSDPGCSSASDNDETNAASTECSDGVDNSDPEDSLVDMADPGCSSPSDNDETNAVITQCSDGIDNADPEDTLVDMSDPGCSSPADNDETNAVLFNFSLTNSGGKVVVQGNSVQNLITANLISGSTQNVDFSVSGLPSGATFSFSASSCSPTCQTTLTINAALSTPPGDYIITVSGISAALTRTTQFTLTVNQAPPCADGVDNDGDGFTDSADPSCDQSDGGTEYSACNDLNSYPGGTPRDNDGDGKPNSPDPGCHSDGNPNNPASYNPNDNDESNTIFKEVFIPIKWFLALLNFNI